MVAVITQPAVEPKADVKKGGPFGMPAFTFNLDDMTQLLNLFYYGSSEAWRSHLEKLDNRDRLSKDKAQLYNPEDREYGNPLLQQVTHKQLAWAIRQLKNKTVARGGEQIKGWHEYCLRVMVGKTDVKAFFNRGKPMVRHEDKAKALIALTQAMRLAVQFPDQQKVLIDEQLQPNRTSGQQEKISEVLKRLMA